MPGKNKKGGKKHKKNKREAYISSTLRLKEEKEGQEYAQFTKCKGNCRFDVKCCDGKERAALLCGAMRKRKFIGVRDIVLVSLRDFQDNICDIIDSYDESQARKLKEDGHLPKNFKIEEENIFLEGVDDSLIFSNDIPVSSDEEGDKEDNEEDDSSSSSDSGIINLDEI